MPIRVALHHRTRYDYSHPVQLSPQVVRLRPAVHSRSPVTAYSLNVVPEPPDHFCNWQQDPYGNQLARLVFPKPTKELEITVDLVAEMTVINPFDFFVEDYAEHYPFVYEAALAKELIPFTDVLPVGERFARVIEYARKTYARAGRRTLDVIIDVNQHVQRSLKYLIRMEPGVQSPEETLKVGQGSCRDFAWLMVQLVRHLGLAARFVSGYSIQLKADVKALDGPSGVENDCVDLHAWCEVYLPGAGWVGFDATSGLACGEGHIPLACTADPGQAAPITGGFSYPEEIKDHLKSTMSVEMTVRRIHEDPRVTLPYTDAQWAKIAAMGHQVDERLNAADVRLTMGGEPTFVSIDDMEGAEWNTEALGRNKRILAGRLLHRLHDRFVPSKGGFLHYGQGKWYPGEQLPRWALACYWRRDGVPMWNDPSLVADESRDYGHGVAEAQEFLHLLAHRLGVNPDLAHAGYEDIFYYLWKERRLPVNVDPLNSQLKDEMERARLARLFEQGLEKVTGYALPIERRWNNNRAYWISGAWFFRPERMYLLPGDSPMGYRLPLESLPWVAATDIPYDFEETMSPRPPLPPRADPYRGGQPVSSVRADPRTPQHIVQQRIDSRPADLLPSRGQSAPWIIRTALCVEPREGRLHVFIPPQRCLEDYVDLVAKIEDTSASLKMPVVCEGYPPPYDWRVNQIKVTPDPGVIEVNIHPAESWDQMVNTTTALYEEARQCRLGTEKFQLDGRHTGTGGGNHIVVGGSTPANSPFLRRPDLLRSLLAYWHNHPSLSYLFSTMFIGPTSQAPRVDEGRRDAIYELEIAFKQIPDGGGAGGVPPWLADRTLRNLLVDLTGNTHRAEFCIDKLFSPDSPSGRLGLLEFRGFEMPPHARMSLTQQLLLRSMISRFWNQPYTQPLVRWGTDIHDRNLLPHFSWSDFEDVIDDMQRAGYGLSPEWFAPHFEFRFPRIGSITQRNLALELRTAIEPWYVLGEEGYSGGTARYVDSSVERLQVKVDGMIDTRHVVTCNGRTVPLHPTGMNGQFVAGVRYRAWAPPSSLHPTIGIHSPLVFDVVDRWSGRSIGGCTYHVVHPGGRAEERFPVNALEAESRRNARFQPFGHTPGPMQVVAAERTGDYPFTLDLRT